MAEKFTTNIHVDRNIISLLSKSTYLKSLSSAIRELISNAYDADSLSVHINISYDYKTISIEDDGNGMTRQEFDNYLNIAGTKSDKDVTRRFKRKRIGQFGVGFIAIFPFCEKLEITTTSENSDEILIATIPAFEYFDGGKKRYYVQEIPITGTIINDKSQRQKHYTKIKLINPTYSVQQYFTKINTKKRDSVVTFNPFDKFKWELQEDLPISFNPKLNSINLIEYKEPIGISVFVNGKPIYRNELQQIVLESGSEVIQGIECKYVFTTDYSSIKPMEARGIKRRVNNVGIGPRTDFELKRDRGFSRLHWISGEIHLSEKVKDLLTISRDSFVSSTVIDEINEFFATKLRGWAYVVEDIAVAEKEIDQVLTNSKKANLSSRKEVIEKNLEVLKSRGFQVIKKDEPASTRNSVVINKEKKIVTLYKEKDIIKDSIEVLGKKYQFFFSKTGFKLTDPPCKFIDNQTIEINALYPLFKSKTYGNLFQKLHIMLLIAKTDTKQSKELYDLVVQNMLTEFNQYK